MCIEQEALEFINRLETVYFEKRDGAALLQEMSGRFSLIGTGAADFSHNCDEARAALQSEIELSPQGFVVTNSNYSPAALPGGSSCVVTGEIWARALDPKIADLYYRITAVVAKTGDAMKLVHLHLSRPDPDQESGAFYALKSVSNDRRELQAQIDRAMRKLHECNREFEAMAQNAPGGMHRCRNDRDLTLICVSRGFLSLFGFTEDEVHTRFQDHFSEMIYPGDLESARAVRDEQLARGGTFELEYRIQRADGKLVWVLEKGRLIPSQADGEDDTLYSILIDITRQKREQEHLRLSLERHRVIMDQTTDIIFEWDIVADRLHYSSNWNKKFGYEPIHSHILTRLPSSPNIHPEDLTGLLTLIRGISAGKPYSETEFRIRDSSGRFSWCRIRSTTQFDSERRPIRAVGVIVDIDIEKRQRQELLRQAQLDELTGLYNKKTIEQMIERSLQSHKDPHALLIIDIDYFKDVNDTYGHQCGDALLVEVSDLLKKLFRCTDLVGRIGGDEFLVFLPGIIGIETVKARVNGVLDSLRRIRPLKGTRPISCSIGVVYTPGGGGDYTSLCRCADQALYFQKKHGRNGFTFYDSTICGLAVPAGLARTAINEIIESEAFSDVDEELAQYAFRLLYNSVDLKTAVNQILALVGSAYDVSRAYIFENSDDGSYCYNSFEWCGKGVSPQIGNLQHLSYEELGGYLDNFDSEGIFYCRDIKSLHPDLYRVLAPQGICSLLQCAILENGEVKGYVGFDECRESRHWTKQQIKSLTLVSNVLSTFLLKHRLKERLARLDGPAKPSGDAENGPGGTF